MPILVTILHVPFNMNTRLRMPFIDPLLAVLGGAGLLFAAERMGFQFSRGGEDGRVKASLKRLASSAVFIAASRWRCASRFCGGPGTGPRPRRSSEPYGFEAGRIAESIASGRGFSSPLLLVTTGPTAYLCPIYPYLLAGIFKIWGIYSFKSEVIAQALNCLFAALTVFPIFAVAKRTFGSTSRCSPHGSG